MKENVLCVAVVVKTVAGIPPDFDYDFSGFEQQTQLLIEDCTGILGQVCKYVHC
jgi:hypothetical protein